MTSRSWSKAIPFREHYKLKSISTVYRYFDATAVADMSAVKKLHADALKISREVQIIDGAYGLVLGAFDGLLDADDRAWREWNKPHVQAAAIAATTEFFKKIDARTT